MATLVVDVVNPDQTWGQDLAARLPGADRAAILRELGNVACEFTKYTLCIVNTLDITLVDGTASYDMNPVAVTPNPGNATWSGMQALYAHHVFLPEYPNWRIYPRDHYPGVSTAATGGWPLPFWCPYPGVIEFSPAPNSSLDGTVINVATAMVPIRPAKDLPVMLRDYYYDAILDGTVGRMMAHAKRPYSDSTLATYHTKRFRNQMREAKDETGRRWSNAESSFRFPPTWANNR